MTNLKKIFLLIVLKIVEVAVVIFIPYYIGKFMQLKISFFNGTTNLVYVWGVGFSGLYLIPVSIFAIYAISFLISEWFKLNSKLIDRIIK